MRDELIVLRDAGEPRRLPPGLVRQAALPELGQGRPARVCDILGEALNTIEGGADDLLLHLRGAQYVLQHRPGDRHIADRRRDANRRQR